MKLPDGCNIKEGKYLLSKIKKKIFSDPCMYAKGRNIGINFGFHSAGKLQHVDQHLYQPYCGHTVIPSKAEYVNRLGFLSVSIVFHNIGLFCSQVCILPILCT